MVICTHAPRVSSQCAVMQWSPTLGLQMFLDYNSQQPSPPHLLARISGSWSPKNIWRLRLGTTAVMVRMVDWNPRDPSSSPHGNHTNGLLSVILSQPNSPHKMVANESISKKAGHSMLYGVAWQTRTHEIWVQVPFSHENSWGTVGM